MPIDKSKVTPVRNPVVFSAKYAWLTIKHKWFVFRAGRRLGVPVLRLLKHDLSKFGLAELVHYGRAFFGPADQPMDFSKCWLHHQNHNDHHWEYWILRTNHDLDSGSLRSVPMARDATTEMVADWMGACRTYDGHWPEIGNWPWLKENFTKIQVHPETRRTLVAMLEKYLQEDREGKKLCKQ